MGKEKIIAACALIAFATATFAQTNSDEQPFVKKHLLRTQGNLSFGYLTKLKLVPIYVAGDMDFYFDERVSLFGEVSFFLSTNEDTKFIKYNNSLFSGINYHLSTGKRFDPYVGINPGIIMGQYRVESYPGSNEFRETKVGVVPAFSASLGFNYYIGSVFNFFVRVRYIQAQFFADSPNRIPLSEIRVSAGLGWNWKWFQKK